LKKTDIIFIHAPSVYDFRKKSILFGPMSDLVPSTPIFELYPIGFLTMANYLSKKGLDVRIINIAYRMYEDWDFDVEGFLAKLDPVCFGIDLHWLPHCQGSTEIAKILKKQHPATPIIFGGFSSSYFHEELIAFDQVDYIVRGDSTEEPLFRLLSYLKDKDTEDIKNIPNLTYKEGGRVKVNEIGCISKDLSEIDFDYTLMFRQVLRYKDIKSLVPFTDWFRYPITTIPIVRGCYNDCAGCGGSKSAFEVFGNRTRPAFRDPKKLVEEIEKIQHFINGPIFILGDINSNGREYVSSFFDHVSKLKKKIQIFFEFFTPPGKWFYDRASEVFDQVCYEISPDSHDERIRKILGKRYSNEEMLESIGYALSKGATRYDLYFMTGLPFQDKASIIDTVKFSEKAYQRLGWDKRFFPFISPMAPFLDPGSRAFEDPKSFGYRLLAKTLKEHIEAVVRPSWRYILNYESEAITTQDLVDSTYQAAIGLNRLKGRSGAIENDVMEANEERIYEAVRIMKEIDKIVLIKDNDKRDKRLNELKDRTYEYSLSTVCEKKELEFPFSNKGFNWLEILKATLLKRW